MKSFNQFYRGFGLSKYPFSAFSTEDEIDIADILFTQPTSFSVIKDNFLSGQTIIMSGNRGIGKTAVLYNLKNCAEKNPLTCIIDDYSTLPINPTIINFYEAIGKCIINNLFTQIIGKEKFFLSLNRSERVFLSRLYYKFIDPATKSQLRAEIEKIQLSPLKRFANKFSGFIRLAINFGLTVAIKLLNDVIATKFGILSLEDSKIKEIVPEISFSIDDQFIDVDTSYESICNMLGLIHKLGFGKVIVFFDKVDEDNRFTNDAEMVASFIIPLLTDNKLLSNHEIQLFVSIWSIPFTAIKHQVRTQKYYCPELLWQNFDLIATFDQRMKVHSDGEVREWSTLFALDVTHKEISQLLKLANGNPRDLWHLMDNLFRAQYDIDPDSSCISLDAIRKGQIEFVRTFNYFEYYPRKKYAKKNSMDVYKYINHLLKLSSNKFTTNQLGEEAQTGSSAINYITGMQNIGLIRRTDETRSGGCLYETIDPKVVFARENRIKIES